MARSNLRSRPESGRGLPVPSVSVSAVVSLGHRLPDYDGICSSPHGHNARFVATVRSDVFLDFKRLSDALWKVVEPMDHAMVLRASDPLLELLRGLGFRTVALSVSPTTEALASYVFGALVESGIGCEVVDVVVHETDRYSARATTVDFEVRRLP